MVKQRSSLEDGYAYVATDLIGNAENLSCSRKHGIRRRTRMGRARELASLFIPRRPPALDQAAALSLLHPVKMPPKKASKPEKSEIPIQPVPEKRGYEFGGP